MPFSGGSRRTAVLRPRRRPLLDGTPGLYAVLGLQKLLSSYAGPLVRGRRAYDETERDFYPDQTGWVSSEEIKSWGGGRPIYCTKWYDQTGNLHHGIPTTTAAQSHAGMMEPVFDLSGKYPSLFFGGAATAPCQALIIDGSRDFLRNRGAISYVAVARSYVHASASNRAIVAGAKNDSASRAQISVAFPTTTYSTGGRRQNADSFTAIDGPAADTDWHVFVARLDYANADIFFDVDRVAAANTSWLTAGVTPDADAFWEVNIGMATNRSGGFFAGQMTAVILMTTADPATARLVDSLRSLFPIGNNGVRSVGHSHTLTSKFTTTTGGQGFCGDQTNFWIGFSVGDGGAGTIYKVDYAGVAVDDWSAIVTHAQSVFLRPDNDTLCVGDYDSTGVNAPKLQEMSKVDGAAVRDWQFTGVGYAKAPTFCYYAADQVLLLTHPDMTFTGAPQISLVQINDNETFSVLNSWRFENCLGVMQGLQVKDGFVYAITADDAVEPSHANGTIYKLRLDGGDGTDSGAGKVAVVASFPQMRAQGGESEGITWDGLAWYMITNADGATIRVNTVGGLT